MVIRPSRKHLSRLCASASHKSNRLTSFGINNNGHLIYDYYHEDVKINDILGETHVYNGYDSVLWVNFEQAFSSEIREMYQSWRTGQDPLLTYDKVIENFITNHSDKWSISIYNEDAEYKYISMYRTNQDAKNLYQVKGTGEEHLKYFIKNRLMYCDSKWRTGDFVVKANAIILRTNKPLIQEDSLAPNGLINFKTFSNMYAAVGFGSKRDDPWSKYTPRDKVVTFEMPEDQTPNDLDTYIYGADEVSSLEDISRLYCGSVNVSAATKLTRLIVGNSHPSYANNNLTELFLTNNRLLKELNICNCKTLSGVIDLSLCPDIEQVYAAGSGITGVSLPSAGFLKKISLPSTIATLTITNQKRLQEFLCDGYENITHLVIENSYFAETERFPLQEVLEGCHKDMLVSVSIKDISWNVSSEATLNSIISKFLDAEGKVKNGFVFEGTVYLPKDTTLSKTLKDSIHAKFPNLNVIDDDPVLYVDYLDYYKTIVYTEHVTPGQNAQGSPIVPENIYDINGKYQYIFDGWGELPTNVQTNCEVTANWQTKYAVTFWNEDKSTKYDAIFYNAYEKPEIPADILPTKPSESPTEYKYVFNGWAGLPDTVMEPVDVSATFIKSYPVRFYNETTLYDEQWVKDGAGAVKPHPDPTKVSTTQYAYTFSGWDVDYTNITKATTVKATYTSAVRSYPVYFHYYNGSEDSVYNAGSIKYGNTATYGGTTPIRKISASDLYTSADYEWTKKWSPEPIPTQGAITKVNGEEAVHCYPVFKFIATLEDTWDDIANNVATLSDEELFQRYPIGARKNIEFTIDDTQYNTVVEVIGHNHDDLADGSGKAKLTFFTNELPNLQRFLSTTENLGWGGSELRTFMNNDLFNAFPDNTSVDGNLQGAIKLVKKKYNNGYDPLINIVESEDKCWAASDAELNLVVDKANSIYLKDCFVLGQGEVYSEAFSNDASRKRFVCGDSADKTVGWWTRSIYKPGSPGASNMAWYIYANGSCGGQGSLYSTPKYVAFGFCI